MKELRMPKGWVHVGTNALETYRKETVLERKKREHRLKMLIRKTPKLSLEDLMQEGFNAAKEFSKKENSYRLAEKEGRLLSTTEKLALKEERKKARELKKQF